MDPGLCGKSYRCLVLVTRLGSTNTWYSPGPSAGEHHLPLVLVCHHDRQRVTGLLFFVVHTYCRFGICLPHPKTTTCHHQPSATTHAFAWHSQHKTSIQQVSTTCLLGCPGVTMEFGTLFCKDEKKKSAPKFYRYLRAP